jgi:RES domain-containing protein
MIVYRITHQKFADKLVASGIDNRWNLSGQFVIYTSANRALACLENLVHTNGESLSSDLYMCLSILIPGNAGVTNISLKELPQNFANEKRIAITKEIGNKWYKANNHLLLQTPSVIIPSENNFMINTMHDDFKKIKIVGKDEFKFDERLIFPRL